MGTPPGLVSSTSAASRGAGIAARGVQRQVDHELHHLAGGGRISRYAEVAAEGRIRSGVDHAHHRAVSQTAEVDDHVRTFGRTQQQRLFGESAGYR